MQLMRAEVGSKSFILMGLCSGADIAFQASASEGRIAGLVMLNPRTFCMYDLDTVDSGHYKGLMSHKQAWLKLLREPWNVPRIASTFAAKLERSMMWGIKGFFSKTDEISDGGHLPTRLRSLVDSGVDIFLLVTEDDPGIKYVDANFGKEMRSLLRVSGFRRHDLKGTDHTFTALFAQKKVVDLIIAHIEHRHKRGRAR